MGMSSVPIGSRYGRVCGELLDMGARIAVRSYSHCPQTGRMYYKPPPTPGDADRDSSSFSSPAEAASVGAGASSSAAEKRQQQQEEAATKVVFEASEFILYGGARH